MVRIRFKRGRLRNCNILALITAADEPLTIEEVLLVLRTIFESEDLDYPKGLGRRMLMNAITRVYLGEKVSDVIRSLGLKPRHEEDERQLEQLLEKIGESTPVTRLHYGIKAARGGGEGGRCV
jgi:hypothetical protein